MSDRGKMGHRSVRDLQRKYRHSDKHSVNIIAGT